MFEFLPIPAIIASIDTPVRCSHLPHNYCSQISFSLTPSSLVLIPIRIEPKTPRPQQSVERPCPLITSLQEVD